MTICSVWMFTKRLDINIIFEAMENLCAHYPQFCMVPKHGTLFETPIWSRPYHDWTFKDNFILHALQEPSTACLQKYMAQEYAKPFDFEKPLWEVHYITGLQDGHTAFLWKAHHSMSDGIGIMKAVMATTTSFDPVEVTKQQLEQLQRRRSEGNIANHWHDFVLERQRQKRKKNDRHSHHHHHHQQRYEKAMHKVRLLWHQVMFWLLWTWQLLIMVTQQVYHELWTMSLLVEPPLQQLRQLVLLPIRQRKPTREMFYEDDQTYDKLIAWTDDIDLTDIQKVQRGLGGGTKCTLNDVMLMIFVRSVRRYIQQKTTTNNIKPSSDVSLRIIIPLSFRFPTDYAMKNVVTGNMVGLNTGTADNTTTTTTLLKQVHRRMMTVKRSILPYAMYHVFIQTILRYLPFLMMPMWMQHWYTDIPHAIFTNIFGPTNPTSFGGQEMTGFHVLPPQAGKGSISVGLVSYCNKVNISMLTDNHPDYPDLANVLCKVFIDEFKSVLAEASEKLDNDTPGCNDSDDDNGAHVK
ncbi:unnamed protein product [Absidia cylindrospora]